MEQILLAYGLHKETVAALMMLYKNTKVKVRSPDGDTDFFLICRRLSARGYFRPIPIHNLPKILSLNVDRFKERKWCYTGNGKQTITDSDYVDIALQANTTSHAESQMHSLEWATGGIGLHGNANKTEYMCFNQRGYISILNGDSLKLVVKFTYVGSSVSSTEKE